MPGGRTAVRAEAAPARRHGPRGFRSSDAGLCPAGAGGRALGTLSLGTASQVSERLSFRHRGGKVKYEI